VGKRAFDVIVGTVLCLVALPLMLLGALVSMVSLRTLSPLFRQERVGFGGVRLGFPKLRTMPKSMPAYGLKTEISFDELPWTVRFLRRTHIDELPQLFLVVTGALSLVGPRPKMPDAVEPVDADYGAARVQVPQGCTGLWQISVAKPLLPNDHPEYDLFYVAHHSLRLDLWILWRTLAHGLGITKLITLDDVPAWAGAPQGSRAAEPSVVLDLTERSVEAPAR
jgi:lipopolysaccharide/colanic/teichoic acid biosynthesis glycosyltransferase